MLDAAISQLDVATNQERLDEVERILFDLLLYDFNAFRWTLTWLDFYRGKEVTAELFRSLDNRLEEGAMWNFRLEEGGRSVFPYYCPLPAVPRWDGSQFGQKTLLIVAEGGLGDTLNFIRFAPNAKARGGRVLVYCQPELISLLRGTEGVDGFYPWNDAAPPCDFAIPSLSLPGALGCSASTVPNDAYVQAAPNRIRHWRAAIGRRGFRIGIAWTSKDCRRCIRLPEFAVLAAIPGVRLISLLNAKPNAENVDWPLDRPLPETSNLVDLAALMHSLDLIVTVDTMHAHLAGSMGLPVWTLLPKLSDWRWGAFDAEQTYWYPSMRLFRQSAHTEWHDVVERIAREVADYSQVS
jgi:hypothetical protein